MQIRTKITLLFVVLNTLIVVTGFIFIYFFSSNYRSDEFLERLNQKAIKTARLFADVEEVDARLLRIIQDEKSRSIPNEQVKVFDLERNELYQSSEGGIFIVPYDFFIQLLEQGSYQESIGNFELTGIRYEGKRGTFLVIAGGYDRYGISKLKNLRRILLIATLISLLAVGAAGWIYSGRVLFPISRVIKQVDKITPDNLHARVEKGNSKDEIYRLAITFNRLLERIQQAFTVQKTFVANASHELRTPLTVITGQLEVVLLKERSPADYQVAIKSVLDDIKNLNRISNRLLLLAQAEKDPQDIPLSLLRIDELVWAVRQEVMKRYSHYTLHVSFKKDPDDEHDLTFKANEQLMQTAISNLIENACKFSENKSVSIEIDFDSLYVYVTFIDNGIGIAKDELEQIFLPFYRSRDVINYPGTGLGLAMVQKIVQLHKGYIHVQSTKGKGTTITIKLDKQGIRA
jgi:signal transduction histidine kinase